MSCRLISAAEAEHQLGVPARRVRVWAYRRKLFATGLDASNRPLYKEADIRALMGSADTPKAGIPRQRAAS
ncbi:MAG TPA: hypothetical protein VN738_03615 [Acidothermaceae bacterium]|nr:hypothetical protein [Acidothermaceae bacterium]